MQKKLITACAVIVLLPMLVIGIQALQIASELHAQERLIKKALRTTPKGALLSNAPDGATRFIETGKLVF